MQVPLSAQVSSHPTSGLKAPPPAPVEVTETVKFCAGPRAIAHASVPVLLNESPPHQVPPLKLELFPHVLPVTVAVVVMGPSVALQVAALAAPAKSKIPPTASSKVIVL